MKDKYGTPKVEKDYTDYPVGDGKEEPKEEPKVGVIHKGVPPKKDGVEKKVVKEEVKTPVDESTDRKTYNCPDCKGLGLQNQATLCPRCNGTGKV